ncbi:putative nuclease HARBI1 [Cheilinus undulatus]|uniref:putative nuclease HARBI1 n=1 Tax=Cheilinus undulatus TaxID=241271 RepID=UPI001BD62E1F|nr:putative nuclease HARBI1 [Cheilinus undulatus]
MARPFLEDVLDEEALIIRRAFGRERVFRDRSDPLVFGDDYLIERYRFSGNGLRYLCRLLGPEIQHQTVFSHALTVPWMVSVTVRFLASGSFLYSVGDAENLNKGTIHLAVRRVCLALKSLIHIFITFPGHRRLLYIKEDFYKIAAFPKVIGAVDCTHIRIQRPSGEHEGDYGNRKSFHSISVQMICDANCLVSDLEAKWPESVHDSRVFRASPIHRTLLQDKPHIFASTLDIMSVLHLLKSRFQCLHHLRVSPPNACDVIVACTVLHNIAGVRKERARVWLLKLSGKMLPSSQTTLLTNCTPLSPS